MMKATALTVYLCQLCTFKPIMLCCVRIHNTSNHNRYIFIRSYFNISKWNIHYGYFYLAALLFDQLGDYAHTWTLIKTDLLDRNSRIPKCRKIIVTIYCRILFQIYRQTHDIKPDEWTTLFVMFISHFSSH
jgi:hypothetical protein